MNVSNMSQRPIFYIQYTYSSEYILHCLQPLQANDVEPLAVLVLRLLSHLIRPPTLFLLK